MAKQAAKNANSQKRPSFFARMGKRFKDMFNELKKVSWPTRQELVRLTGVVIIFVAIFAIVVGAMDYGLLRLMKLITGAIGGQAS